MNANDLRNQPIHIDMTQQRGRVPWTTSGFAWLMLPTTATATGRRAWDASVASWDGSVSRAWREREWQIDLS